MTKIGSILIVVGSIFLAIGFFIMPSLSSAIMELKKMSTAIVWVGLGGACAHVGLFMVFIGPIHERLNRMEQGLGGLTSVKSDSQTQPSPDLSGLM
ncbi:MAG TPA: hypothetical protein DHV69_06745 [Sphaerochaeta sp.]|jgi:hypothetical protein|nr:MAG: hypothetical protein A2Y31_10850 [Spirochaetes bacterium GWC2_52_13]PKL22381.1 MAG: hypothetical protein CVV48_02705 [Spirochaetae bacterium HGW-Spirochaetae-4]HCG62471.1 hypothetical protein [Sphaerochaeta sp.]HCJ94888.1 hypothetical protein [Sphaerochaeta sp.]HCS37069.1 hypothetical protein [Sphaerochaeta sp.]